MVNGEYFGSSNDVWVKDGSCTFQTVIQEILNYYIPAFKQVFLDDFAVYSRKTEHFEHLQLCL